MNKLEKPVYEEAENWIEFYGESDGNICGIGCGLEW